MWQVSNIVNEKYTKGKDVQPTAKALKMWNGSELKPIGITRLIVKNPKIGKKFSVEFVVVPDDYTLAHGQPNKWS